MKSDVSLLVSRAARGDLLAADQLARRFDPRLRRFIRPRLGHELRATLQTDDICQSALHTAFVSLDNFRYEGQDKMFSWLAKIAEQKIRSAVRYGRAKRRDHRRNRPIEHCPGIPDAETSPTEQVARSEVARNLRSAVGGLPSPEREVVLLHSYDGRSFEDVAEVLGYPDKSAARRIFLSAIRQIGRMMDGA